MRKTGKEISQTANQFERQEWLLTANAKEICDFFSYCPHDSHAFQFARAALDIRISRDAENLNRRIYWLTLLVAILTTALVSLTVVLVILTIKLTQHP